MVIKFPSHERILFLEWELLPGTASARTLHCVLHLIRQLRTAIQSHSDSNRESFLFGTADLVSLFFILLDVLLDVFDHRRL